MADSQVLNKRIGGQKSKFKVTMEKNILDQYFESGGIQYSTHHVDLEFLVLFLYFFSLFSSPAQLLHTLLQNASVVITVRCCKRQLRHSCRLYSDIK